MPNRLFQQGKSAIYAHVGGPNRRYKTRQDYISTWHKFAAHCNQDGIECAEQLTVSTIEDFAELLSLKSASTQHNYHSRISIVIGRIRPDLQIPSRKDLDIPDRTYLRTRPVPNHSDVLRLIDYLSESNQWRFKLMVELAYWGGLRRREAMLLPLYQARKRAIADKNLEVRFGTKGGAGHAVIRDVPINTQLRQILLEASNYGLSDNLIPQDNTRAQFSNAVSNNLLPILKNFNIPKLHDLRCAYACRRYEKILGVPAPILGGEAVKYSIERDRLLAILSRELGHGRVQVMTSYVGSFRVKREENNE